MGYFKLRDLMMCEILRPNLIVYLDAPVDVVQRKIRERAEKTHPWEKNSPVYENTGYLNHLYNDLFKKQYLQEAGIHSYVLTSLRASLHLRDNCSLKDSLEQQNVRMVF